MNSMKIIKENLSRLYLVGTFPLREFKIGICKEHVARLLDFISSDLYARKIEKDEYWSKMSEYNKSAFEIRNNQLFYNDDLTTGVDDEFPAKFGKFRQIGLFTQGKRKLMHLFGRVTGGVISSGHLRVFFFSPSLNFQRIWGGNGKIKYSFLRKKFKMP